MTKQQIGTAAGIAALCAVLWFLAGDSKEGDQLADIAGLGLIGVVVIVALKLLQRRGD